MIGVEKDGKYPIIFKSWRTNWDRLSKFYDYTNAIRRIIWAGQMFEWPTVRMELLNYFEDRLLKNDTLE